MVPAPWQFSHRPPFTLKLKRPALYPRDLASGRLANKSRIPLKTPTYVAGLERGVRPIGLWSIFITLSIFSSPVRDLYAPTGSFERITALDAAGQNTSLKSVDLPEPDTPVIQVKTPRGISIEISFKLCSVTPERIMCLPLPSRLLSGTGIVSEPAKY